MAKVYRDILISEESISLGVESKKTDIPDGPKEAQHNIEQIRTESYETGFIKGKEEALEQFKLQYQDSIKKLDSLMASISQAMEQNRLDLSSEICDIVLYIVKPFFVDKATDIEELVRQINQILSQINTKQTIELLLHPQDIEFLKENHIKLACGNHTPIHISADESLGLGGCVIKTDHGVFDASIEKQIDKLKEFLLELRMRGNHAPSS